MQHAPVELKDCSSFHATPLVPSMGSDGDGKMRMGRRLMGRLKAPHTCQNYADDDDDDDDDDDGHAGALPTNPCDPDVINHYRKDSSSRLLPSVLFTSKSQ